MRAFLVISALLLHFGLTAKSITVHVIEGWKSTPFPNAKVNLLNASHDTIQTGVTDSKGDVQFEIESNYALFLFAYDSLERFINNYPVTVLESKSNYQIILYPTFFYERKMIKREDSLVRVREIYDAVARIRIDSLSNIPDSISKIMNATLKDAVLENITYPEISQELGDQGRVYVQCIVETDGTITHVEIARGVSPELDKEAKRVIRTIERFDFLQEDIRYNRVRMRFPITFTLH